MSAQNKKNQKGNKKGNYKTQAGNGKQFQPIGSSDLLTGLAGAFLGSILGVAFWVLIGWMGYFPCIAGLALIMLTFQGYKMLGGILDTKGLIISGIISILMVQIANQIYWVIHLYSEYKSETGFTFFETFQNLAEVLEKYDLTKNYMSDFGFGCLWAAVGAVIVIVNMVRQSSEE